MKRTWTLSTVAATAVSALLVGCGPSAEPHPAPTAEPAGSADHGHSHDGEEAHSHDEGGGHSHGAGPHDGTLADWGGGKYHVEFTVDHDKKESVVYVVGGDEKTPSPIKATELLLSINEPSFQVTLKADPQEGDPEGSSSRFVGQHESLGIVQEFAGTISGEVEGTPYAGDFKEEPHGHEH